MTFKPVGVDEDSHFPARVEAHLTATIAAAMLAGAVDVGDEFGGTYPSTSLLGAPYLYKPNAIAGWAVVRGSAFYKRASALFCGDSTTAGVGGADSTSIDTLKSVANAPASQVRARTAAQLGIDPGEGIILPVDLRWAFAGGAASVGGSGYTGPMQRYISIPAGGTATIILNGTDFELWYFGQSGAMAAPTVTVDGAPVTVPAAGAAAAMKAPLGTFTDGAHTIVITGVAPGCRIGGVVARRNPGKGIEVHQMGIGGYTAGMAAGELLGSSRHYMFEAQFGNLNPDLVVLQFGINDWITQVPVATYKANMRLMADYIVTTLGKSVILSDSNETFHDPAGYAIKRGAYSAALRELCDELPRTAYWSIPSLIGGYAKANAAGMMLTGSSHPNSGGYGAIATGEFGVLMNPRLGLI